MQINGLREFSSQIASLNGLTGMQNSSFLRGLTEQNQTSVARDSLILSETGKRFSLNTEKSLSLTQTQEEEQDISNPALKLMDEGLTEAKAILEKMHELASLAMQQDLTDLERVEIQIEIEDLRRNLDSVSANLGLRAQKMGGLPVEEPVEIPTPGNLMSLNIKNPPKDGDGSSILERMRDRIMKKQEWDVVEIWAPDYEELVKNGKYEEFEDGEWIVADEFMKFMPDESTRKLVETMPTVRERLERNTPVLVIDAQSAAEGVEFLEEQTDSVQKSRDRVAKTNALLIEQQSKGQDTTATGRDIRNMLDTIPDRIGAMAIPQEYADRGYGDPLTNPDKPYYYYFQGTIFKSYERHIVENYDETFKQDVQSIQYTEAQLRRFSSTHDELVRAAAVRGEAYARAYSGDGGAAGKIDPSVDGRIIDIDALPVYVYKPACNDETTFLEFRPTLNWRRPDSRREQELRPKTFL